ncbi:hypothetical protein MMC22_002796 [Lobaria immixta]|nr:hypothetical protein [Lobaria immixta]
MALPFLETPPALSLHLNPSRDVIHTSSSLPTTPILPARPPSPGRRPLLPEDSSAFLTVLAGQERRVLELKEELERAESDLEILKRQWALHETSKKKNEIRHIEQLRPISKFVSDKNPFGPNGLSAIAKEQDRQKPPSTNTKKSQRKVFSGSKHTRALSLLSPKLPSNQQTMPSRAIVIPTRPRNTVNRTLRSEISVGKSTIVTNRPVFISTAAYNSVISPPKDAILETGKQLVGDFREGLWTFFEDLRQATVGDEAISNSDSRNSPYVLHLYAAKNHDRSHKGESIDLASVSEGTKNVNMNMALDNRKPPGDACGPNEKGNVLHKDYSPDRSTFSSTKASSLSQVNPNPNESDDDGWDNWDSPKPKDSLPRLSTSTNTSDHLTNTLTEKSRRRTRMRFNYLEVFARP